VSQPNVEGVRESVVTIKWDMGGRILYIGNFLHDFAASRYRILILLRILILVY